MTSSSGPCPPPPEPALALLEQNAIDFLNAGLALLFGKSASERDAKLAIVSLQTAVELFAKQRLVVDYGLVSILRGARPGGDLLAAAKSGAMRTIGFGEALKVIESDEGFADGDREVITNAQQLRNALVHFAAEVEVSEIRHEMAWLLVRVLAMFAAGQRRDQGEMQSHAQFLEPTNFHALINFGPYRAEAVDCAQDSPDTVDVTRCWECDEDTLSERLSGSYFCYCCGFTVEGSAVGHADCVVCNRRKGVLYDPLNQVKGVHNGRCLHCETSLSVAACDDCGSVGSFLSTEPRPSCLCDA